jgi:hypothetical protein
MDEIPVPFVNQGVDTDDPQKGMITVLMLIAGFAVFSFASSIGEYAGSRINSGIAEVIGINPATGESQDDGGVDFI